MKLSQNVARNQTKKATKVRPRAKWGSITRNDIIDAALKMVIEGRYDELTIRSLSAELGVATMSIYGHVKDRDDILDEITDRLLAKQWRPRCSES
ncbi:MAG: TetR/AcrR family transcriptional regulator, partial [Acidimicrobiales bacterium]